MTESPKPEASPLVLSVVESERRPFELTYRANPDDKDSPLVTSTFHFKGADELSLEQQIAIGRNGSLMQRLGEDMAGVSPEEIVQISQSIRQAAKDVIHDMPDHVFAQLKDGHLLALLGAFGEAPA